MPNHVHIFSSHVLLRLKYFDFLHVFKKMLNKTQSYSRYDPPIAPNMEVFQESAVEAFPAAIVGFAVAFSVAKVYSIKHDYTIDGNQVSYT